MAKDLFVAGSQQAKEWTQCRWDELDDGIVRQPVSRYLQHHRNRMRYPEFEAKGYCTPSGVTEGGCKNVIGARLKRSGMHWSVRGADAIIALRCCILSGRLQDTWERILEARRAT